MVLDRYFLSTQAYAEFRGSTFGLDEVASQLLPADMTVYLDVPLHVRRERLATRATTAADAETLSEAADASLREKHAARFDLTVTGQVLCIDGELLTPEQVVARVLVAVSLIKKHKRSQKSITKKLRHGTDIHRE